MKDGFFVLASGTHGSDTSALFGALQAHPKYIGMLGSSRKSEKLRNAARERGFTDEDMICLHSPIGLDIGGETPEEIAIGVMAEILAVRYGKFKSRE